MAAGHMREPVPADPEAEVARPSAKGTDIVSKRGVSPPVPAVHESPPNPAATPRENRESNPREPGERPARAARGSEPGPSDFALAFKDPFATVPDEPEPEPEPEPRQEKVAPEAVELAVPEMTEADSVVPRRFSTAARPRPQPAEAGTSMPGADTSASRASSDADLDRLKSQILDAVTRDGQKQSAPRVSVQATDEGMLISLTDAANDTMFSLGSAEPRQRTIEIMERIARLLATQPGSIVIRGHTDARPYRSGTYDNWRLSTARAHAAHDILVRGGLDDQRVERIEGYADHKPKVGSEPVAPENRRIEILLRKEKS